MSDSCDYGRLEVVLDRSWETRPVTWSNLTWWDPLPCGLALVSSLRSPDPMPAPSPALSVVGQPPTPKRRLPPTQLQFRSCSISPSPSPISARPPARYSSYCDSPLALPLPPSPSPDSQSYNSVFLHSDSSSPPYQEAPTPSSLSSHYCSSPMYPDTTKPIFPTPPDCCSSQHVEGRRDKFSFTRAVMPVPVPVPVPVSASVIPQPALVTPPELALSHSRLVQAGSNSYY